MEKQSKKPHNQNRIENALLGYQVATNLEIYEGHMIWARFSAMLVANSIVIAVTGFIIGQGQGPLPTFSIGMPIAGFILCFLWWIINERGFYYFEFWFCSARELEEMYLKEPVKTFSRGYDLGKGNEIKLTLGGRSEPYRMKGFRRIRIRWVSYMVIGVFAAIHIMTLIWIYDRL